MKKLAAKLSEAYGVSVEILGPYLCQDGRKRVDVRTPRYKRTHQLARVKLEIKLGRKLRSWETVDHIDEDKTNDRYSNLQLMALKNNAYKSARKLVPKTVRCAECRHKITLTKAQRERRSAKKAGPFCSRTCSGRYGAQVRATGKRSKRTIKDRKQYFK